MGRTRPAADPTSASSSDVGERRLVARSTTARRATTPGRSAKLSPGAAKLDPGAGGVGRSRIGTAHSVGVAEWLSGRRLDDRRTRTFLVAASVGVLLAVGIALAFGLRSPGRAQLGAARRPSATRHAPSSTPRPGGGGATSAPRKHAHRRRAGASTKTTPTPATPPSTQAAPATPGGPTLASASPSGGGPGQTVVISGAGLFSSDGEVVAYFGGSAAPTSCASQSSCTVTVPDLGGGPSSVELTVVTASGRSNALKFSYR